MYTDIYANMWSLTYTIMYTIKYTIMYTIMYTMRGHMLRTAVERCIHCFPNLLRHLYICISHKNTQKTI